MNWKQCLSMSACVVAATSVLAAPTADAPTATSATATSATATSATATSATAESGSTSSSSANGSASSSSSVAAPAAGRSVTLTDASGITIVLRTLTKAEIHAKSLTRYLSAGATAASASLASASSTAPAPAKVAPGASPAVVSGCWATTITYPVAFGMAGKGSEDWCGNGSAITYAAAACWGTDGWYPTYNYLGCSMNKFYGVGWNVADTQYNWDMCIAWWGGGCAKHMHLWARYRFGASGQVWRIGYGS